MLLFWQCHTLAQNHPNKQKLGVFWNPQDLLLMMGTEIFKIDAPWAEKLKKTRVHFLMTPTVYLWSQIFPNHP